jgi:hypothetical protein
MPILTPGLQAYRTSASVKTHCEPSCQEGIAGWETAARHGIRQRLKPEKLPTLGKRKHPLC